MTEQSAIVGRVRIQMADVARMRRAAQCQREAATNIRKAVMGRCFHDDWLRKWPRLSLGQIIREPLKNGLSPRPDSHGNYRCLTLSAVRDGVILPNVGKLVSLIEDQARPLLLRAGDIYLIRGNGTKSLVGSAGRCDNDDSNAIYPDTLIRVRLNPELVQSDYFLYVWNSAGIRAQVEAIARTAAGIWKVNQEMLRAVSIPVPPLWEQREIVRRLSIQLEGCEKVSTAARRQLEAIEPLAGALLHEVFGGFEPPRT